MVSPCSFPELKLFIHQSRWKPSSIFFSKNVKSSFVCLFFYLFLQLIFIERPRIFTLSSWSGKGSGQGMEKVREKTSWLSKHKRWAWGLGSTLNMKMVSSREDLEHPWANGGHLHYTFVLPTWFQVSKANLPCWLAEVLGLCTQGQLAGCHHTYINLLASLFCHPFPWEALSSHTSSARKVSVDTSVCITGCSW